MKLKKKLGYFPLIAIIDHRYFFRLVIMLIHHQPNIREYSWLLLKRHKLSELATEWKVGGASVSD